MKCIGPNLFFTIRTYRKTKHSKELSLGAKHLIYCYLKAISIQVTLNNLFFEKPYFQAFALYILIFPYVIALIIVLILSDFSVDVLIKSGKSIIEFWTFVKFRYYTFGRIYHNLFAAKFLCIVHNFIHTILSVIIAHWNATHANFRKAIIGKKKSVKTCLKKRQPKVAWGPHTKDKESGNGKHIIAREMSTNIWKCAIMNIHQELQIIAFYPRSLVNYYVAIK